MDIDKPTNVSSMKPNQKLPVHYSGKFEGSFAYLTIKDRLPVILVKVIDSLCQNRSKILKLYGENIAEELKVVIGELSALQSEVATNKPMKLICDDFVDFLLWNDYLQNQEKQYGFHPSWFDSPWLYSECYFYRRIKQAFLQSPLLKDYDPFQEQKKESFLSMVDAVLVLCKKLAESLNDFQNCKKESKEFSLFRTYLEMSLWGNKWDLSMSAGLADTSHINPLSHLDELREKLLINQTQDVYQILLNANRHDRDVTIDYVLDNAGFELFCDLCFLHFLSSSKLVKKINIHPKIIPWFVSDTLEEDINWLLKTLSKSSHQCLKDFSQNSTAKFESGEWVIIKEKYWTLPHDYSEMSTSDPQLYQRLSQSNLIIFKGDLNYRKLAGDRQWEETISFKQALNGFLPSNLVALRTIKSDVLVGLKQGTCGILYEKSQRWKYTGDYAVIQCCMK